MINEHRKYEKSQSRAFQYKMKQDKCLEKKIRQGHRKISKHRELLRIWNCIATLLTSTQVQDLRNLTLVGPIQQQYNAIKSVTWTI